MGIQHSNLSVYTLYYTLYTIQIIEYSIYTVQHFLQCILYTIQIIESIMQHLLEYITSTYTFGSRNTASKNEKTTHTLDGCVLTDVHFVVVTLVYGMQLSLSTNHLRVEGVGRLPWVYNNLGYIVPVYMALQHTY